MRAKNAATRDRRADILVAARRVLAEKGLEATTISEIVSQARVAQGTFYLYFSSKFAMVYALAEQMLERVLVAVHKEALKATSFSETVEFGLSATFREMGAYADVYAILNNGGGLVENPADWERLFEPYFDLIATLIRRWQAVGQIDPAVHPEIAARLVTSLVERAVEDCYLYHPGIAPEIYIAEVSRFVQGALSGGTTSRKHA
jgi:AcrR family transcriptional regulator